MGLLQEKSPIKAFMVARGAFYRAPPGKEIMTSSTSTAEQTSLKDFIFVLVICWGWFAASSIAISFGLLDQQAFNDAKFLKLISYELGAGALAYTLLRKRGWRLNWQDLRISWSTTGAGLLLVVPSYLAYWLAYDLGTALGGTAEPLQELSKSISVSWPLALLASVVNGAYEELLLSGFIFKALQRYELPFLVGISSLLRVLAHVYQGPVGAMGILFMGVLFSLVYARYRLLWPLIVAHVSLDILALVR